MILPSSEEIWSSLQELKLDSPYYNSGAALKKLYQSGNIEFIYEAYRNPNMHPTRLSNTLKRSLDNIRLCSIILQNPSLPKEAILEVLYDEKYTLFDANFAEALLLKIWTQRDLEKFVTSSNMHIASEAIKNNKVSSSIIEQVLEQKRETAELYEYEYLRNAALFNPNIPIKYMSEVVGTINFDNMSKAAPLENIFAMAGNISMPTELLEKLIPTKNIYLKLTLVSNPNFKNCFIYSDVYAEAENNRIVLSSNDPRSLSESKLDTLMILANFDEEMVTSMPLHMKLELLAKK